MFRVEAQIELQIEPSGNRRVAAMQSGRRRAKQTNMINRQRPGEIPVFCVFSFSEGSDER